MADDLATTETPDPVQEIKDNALGQMAKSEDITAYVAERQDRQAEETGEDRIPTIALPASGKP